MSQNRTANPTYTVGRPMATQPALDPHAIEWLVIAAANNQSLLQETRSLIGSQHFKEVEAPLRLVFEAVCESHDRYGGVTFETVAHGVWNRLQTNDRLFLSDAQSQELFRRDPYGLIFQVCQPTVELNSTNLAYARELLRQLAIERTIVTPLRKVLNPNNGPGVPEFSQFSEFMQQMRHQESRLATLNELPVGDLAPQIGAPLVTANEFVPTGVAFVDRALGGQRLGDCNGLIGPTGGGKTTMAIHMAVAAAKQCYADAVNHNRQSKLVLFITAEESTLKLRPRIWSAFFQIPRRKLETLQDWSQLTQPGQLDPYEREMQINQQYQLSEIERYHVYREQLNASFNLLDLSGSDAFPKAGTGFVDEIVSYLCRYEQPIQSVFLDYAGLFVERHMQAIGADESRYRYLLKTFGDRLRRDVAERFNCTVWALHQLRGGLTDARPGKLMHHSEAGESKDFANNMAVCGCLGVADRYTGCRRLNWSKVRYRPGDEIVPPVLRINKTFSLLDDVTELFTLNNAGQFISVEEQRTVRNFSGLEQHLPQSGPPGLTEPVLPASLYGAET